MVGEENIKNHCYYYNYYITIFERTNVANQSKSSFWIFRDTIFEFLRAYLNELLNVWWSFYTNIEITFPCFFSSVSCSLVMLNSPWCRHPRGDKACSEQSRTVTLNTFRMQMFRLYLLFFLSSSLNRVFESSYEMFCHFSISFFISHQFMFIDFLRFTNLLKCTLNKLSTFLRGIIITIHEALYCKLTSHCFESITTYMLVLH